jgi:DNA invertase Pin-like site-specific DNA recombinase
MPRLTTDQQPHLQVDALERAGCYRVFTETASDARSDRPVLERVLDQLRLGDTLVVWNLDRLGRSLRHLSTPSRDSRTEGSGFAVSRRGSTHHPGGKLVVHVVAALAEFERGLIHERTAAWRQSAAMRHAMV